jgi:hypothetical protein
MGKACSISKFMNAYWLLVGKPKGKRPQGKPRCRCMDNIKMNLREIGCDGMHWIDLVQDREWLMALVHMVLDL